MSPELLTPPAASLPPGSLCETDGWCWYSPLPSGDSWGAVAGAGRTNLWIGGGTPNLLQFDGGRWNVHPSPLLLVGGIWAASENDVWFGGESGSDAVATIAHWDGHAVTATATFEAGSSVEEIWGSGPNDVYATTLGPTRHWDGTAWTTVAGIFGTSVTGTGPNDVWVGGGAHGLQHFDGTSWTNIPQFENFPVFDVSAATPGEVWVLVSREQGGQLERYDGHSTTVVFSDRSVGPFLSAVDVSPAGDAWLVGALPPAQGSTLSQGFAYHFDGTSWSSQLASPTSFRNLARTEGLGVVAVGGNGSIARLVATPTPHIVSLRTGPVARLRSTFGSSPTDMWAVGDQGTILHYDGHSLITVPSPTSAELTDVWGTGPNDVWVVGTAGTLLHYDGSAFTPVSSGTNVDLLAVFTTGANDVWLGGDAGVLRHGAAGSFATVAVPGVGGMAIRDLHGLASDDIWLAGGTPTPANVTGAGTGFVSHFDGTAWSAVQTLTVGPPSNSEPMVRIWELSPNDVWGESDYSLSGAPTHLWHFDGTAWTSSLAGPIQDPAAFMFPANFAGTGTFAFGPHDVWRVGDIGLWQRSVR